MSNPTLVCKDERRRSLAREELNGIDYVKVGETGTTDFGDDGHLSVRLIAAIADE